MPTLAIQSVRLGPYHHARLRATHDLLARKGWTVVGLETARTDNTYAWEAVDGHTDYAIVRALAQKSYGEASPSEIFDAVTSALDTRAPDAVAVMGGYSTPDARAALDWCSRSERPAVLMMESKADDAKRSRGREWVKRMIVSLGDAALAGGTPQKDYLQLLGVPADRIFLPYDVVDNAFFSAGARDAAAHPERFRHLRGLDDACPFFLASNRFLPRKNLAFLLSAYGRYRESVARPWRLVLLGDGPLRAELEHQSGDGVTFAGFRQIDWLPAYYGLASAFVHPAVQDQWGLVVNEAMASGLPVVVSHGAGCSRDLVHDGVNGFTFDPTDGHALTAHLRTISESPHEIRARMGSASRRIVAGWSTEAFAEGIWSALDAAVDHARHRRRKRRANLVLRAVQIASRSSTSFHAIRK